MPAIFHPPPLMNYDQFMYLDKVPFPPFIADKLHALLPENLVQSYSFAWIIHQHGLKQKVMFDC